MPLISLVMMLGTVLARVTQTMRFGVTVACGSKWVA